MAKHFFHLVLLTHLLPNWLQFHISVREFLPIVIAQEKWSSTLRNSTIVLHSDNLAVVQVINKNTSRLQSPASNETFNDSVSDF